MVSMKRLLILSLLPAIINCSPDFKSGLDEDSATPTSDSPPPDDGGSADSGAVPDDPDACDERPSSTICVEGDAVTCDEAGDIASTQPCADEREACIEDLGCATCGVDLDVLHLPFGVESAFVGIRPEVTPENVEIERLHTRPVSIDIIDAERTQGQLEVSIDSDRFTFWLDADTGPVFPEADGVLRINVDTLPADILVHSHQAGSATLSVGDTICEAITASTVFHSAEQPPLTGNPLLEAPWAERVTVFNHTAPVSLTLSPTRHSDRVGQPVQAYVVERKTTDEWLADGTLVDVSSDGAELFFMSDGTTADNVVTLWSGGIDTPTSRYAEFDLVLDYDLDGTLSPGDISAGPGDDAPGFTVMGDLFEPGPHEVDTSNYSGGSWLDQIVYYPADVADMTDVPVVIISHGNGHNYLWYDYLGEHLASHGYVVMSHSNWTGPGIETASWTTLENTDYFLDVVPLIDDGILDGAIDSSRMTWIGHSRGGEGVTRAYDRLFDEGYSTDNYGPEDIALISSIAPTVFYEVEYSNPHDRPYHLFAGAADGDVTGGPSSSVVEYFRLTSVAAAEVQTTYLHGVGHNEFNCCGFDDATGPGLIGRPATQTIAKAYYLALVRAYIDGHEASLDFFSRRADIFRPANISAEAVITNEFRPDPDGDAVAIDDFQSENSSSTASSGSTVSFTVTDVLEGELEDGNGNLQWSSSDPMNGMTQGCCSGDNNRGVIFQFDEDATVSWTLHSTVTDWTPFEMLSLRAAQGTRHPNTMSLDDDLSFSIRVVDSSGNAAELWLGQLGEVTRPYPRTGLGGGVGWSNEFNTMRVRLSDLTEINPALDLSVMAEFHIELGPSYGSETGRLAIDDILLEY